MNKPSQSRESFFLKVLGGTFVRIPLSFSRALINLADRSGSPALKYLLIAVSVFVAAAFFLSMHQIFDWLDEAMRIEGQTAIWIKLSVYYGVYLAVSLPFFFAVVHLNPDSENLKKERQKREPSLNKMRYPRLESNYFKSYLGQSLKTGKPLHLTNDQREMHTLVVGSTGSGKSESVMLPAVAHDIAHGKGMIIIDGKGDLELYDKLRWIVEETGRVDDFYYFSLNHVKESNTFNPFFRAEGANATELTSMLINSQIWTEEFYKKMCEQAALTIFNAIVSTGRAPKFREIHGYLTDLNALQRLQSETKDYVIKNDLEKMADHFKESRRFLSGLIADLHLMSRSEFSDLMDVDVPDIDIQTLYERNSIAYFSLDLQKYTDSSRRLGRMIIQSIRSVSSYIQAELPARKRHFFGIHIDDATDFLDSNFVTLLSKGRASRFAIAMYLQSLGDLQFRNAPGFQQQCLENTNTKIILRQDDPFSIERFVKIAGTRKTMINTYQTKEDMLGKGFTGQGSVREGQTFRIEPDLIRGLKRGEAAVIWKTPEFHTDHVKLDFFGHVSYTQPFNKKDSSERKQKRAVPKNPRKQFRKTPILDNDDEAMTTLEEVQNLRKKSK